jgi:pyridoxal phosphate enzyme (YggS family)
VTTPAACPDVVANLARVRERMAAACARAGRSEDSVRLVAVTKRIPLGRVVEACRAGQWSLAENRIQDALPRQQQLAAALARADLDPAHVRWHFVGHLQRNKANKAVGSFDLIHGVDSLRLAEKLSQRAVDADLTQPVLVQVDAAEEPQKYGLPADDAVVAVERMVRLPALDVAGFMCMARYGAPRAELAATFAALRRVAEQARAATGRPLPELSMGMTDDFEVAIAEGATLVRIGTAIFGPREPA